MMTLTALSTGLLLLCAGASPVIIPGKPAVDERPGGEPSAASDTLRRLEARLATRDAPLRAWPAEAAGAPLTSGAVSSPDPATRTAALEALALRPNERSARLLAGALGDPAPAVRETALRLLSAMDAAAVAEGLLEAAQAEGPRTGARIRASLPALGGAIDPHLLQAAQSRSRALGARQTAVALLGHGQSRDAIPALGSLAASDDPQMALAAAQALAAARDARAIPHLVPLLSHRWPGVRLAAIHGLGAAGGAASVNALGGVAAGGSEPMVPLRLEAIRHLGALGSRKALPALMEALKTPALASAAMQALRNITGENKGGQPGRWVAWWTGRDQRPRTTVRSDVLPESPNPLLPSGVPPEWSLPRKEPASFDEESGQPTELQP